MRVFICLNKTTSAISHRGPQNLNNTRFYILGTTILTLKTP